MTDLQLLTVAIAIVVPAAAVIYSNSRVGDVVKLIGSESALLRSEMTRRFDALEAKLKIHELEHHR